MSIPMLSRSLTLSLTGSAWHGPALDELLGDVTPEEARAHPIPGAHSIVEIVLHVASWLEEVEARLHGRDARMPDSGDWPPACPWPEARARVAAAHQRLLRALASFPEARLSEIVGTGRDAPLGSGVPHEIMLTGLAEHDAYHGGQIAILKRALRPATA
jgi:hypothetical protein